jgi:hypothetical protein
MTAVTLARARARSARSPAAPRGSMALVRAAFLAVTLLLGPPDAGTGKPRLDLVPRPSSARSDERQYELRPQPGGGYRYEDGRFTAVVAPDGHVTFDDKRLPTKVYKLPFLPDPHPEGTPTLEGAFKGLLGRHQAPPPELQVRRPPEIPAPPPIDQGPETWRDRERNRAFRQGALPLVLVKGKGDITDEYYRLMGEDPYRYEKARFLSATFEMRVAMAAKALVHDLRRSLHALPDRLDGIWTDRSQPPAAHRRIFCALWAELSNDDKSVEAARVILTFVRTRLPAGSPAAFTGSELAECNQGRPPGQQFRPYDAVDAGARD